jgi:hypothetical protein
MMRYFILCCAIAVSSGTALADAADPLLFESDSVLELTMPVDFDSLCRPSETPDCDYTPTVFTYRDAAGHEQTVPISIRRRDGWRAQKTNCQVPTLFVRFAGEDTKGTPFEGQSTLAMTSHCGKGISRDQTESRTLPDAFESYVGNEHLGYRIYNLVTENSLKVRFVRIRYAHPEDSRRDFIRNAFFSEHFESLAARRGAELLPQGSFDASKLDLEALDRLSLFNYMIGNTDWSVPEQNNVILLRFPGGQHVPVIYDLDMSGLVNAFYASPAPGLPIANVKQRYYQGYCHPETDWDALFANFIDLEENVKTMLADSPGLGRGDRRTSGVYLDTFFETLDSRKASNSRIIEACQPWPP